MLSTSWNSDSLFLVQRRTNECILKLSPSESLKILISAFAIKFDMWYYFLLILSFVSSRK